VQLVRDTELGQVRRLDIGRLDAKLLDVALELMKKVRALCIVHTPKIGLAHDHALRVNLVGPRALVVKVALRVARRADVDPVRVAVTALKGQDQLVFQRLTFVQDNGHPEPGLERMPTLGFAALVRTEHRDFGLGDRALDLVLIDLEEFWVQARIDHFGPLLNVAPRLLVQLGV